MRTKEEVYDEEISPLMAQIIDICKANHIAMLSSFSLEDERAEGSDGLQCTSCILTDDTNPPDELIWANGLILHGSPWFASFAAGGSDG